MHLLALQLPTTLQAAMSMFSRASSCATGAEHHCGLSALSEFCIVLIFQHAKARLVVFVVSFLFLTASVRYLLAVDSQLGRE